MATEAAADTDAKAAGKDGKDKFATSSTPSLPSLQPEHSSSSPSLHQERQGGTSSRMPKLPPSKLRKREVMQDRNWAEMEAVKGRLASQLDRAEYLATSRNRLTALSGTQGDELWRSLRHRSDYRWYMHQTLQSTETHLEDILEEQRKLMQTNKTAWKRLRQLDKFVYATEQREAGNTGLKAAKASARRASPAKTDYPNYTDLAAMSLSSSGPFRQPPTLAVKGRLPYQLPKEAVLHGWKAGKQQLRALEAPSTSYRSEDEDLDDAAL